MIEQMLAILASMMQQAAHDATLYCAEAKITLIMPRDIELALKRLVLPGSAYWTRDDLLEEAQKIREHLFATDSSGTESDSDDSWVTDVGDAVVVVEFLRVSEPNCATAVSIQQRDFRLKRLLHHAFHLESSCLDGSLYWRRADSA
jgi:hypothetical protein